MFVTLVLERVSVEGKCQFVASGRHGEAGWEDRCGGGKGERKRGQTLGGITRFVVLGEVAEVEVFQPWDPGLVLGVVLGFGPLRPRGFLDFAGGVLGLFLMLG